MNKPSSVIFSLLSLCLINNSLHAQITAGIFSLPQQTHAPIMTINYLLQTVPNANAQWLGARAAIVSAGGNPNTALCGIVNPCKYPAYADQADVTLQQMYDMRNSWAIPKGFNFETEFLHQKSDYSLPSMQGGGGDVGNVNLGQFDGWDDLSQNLNLGGPGGWWGAHNGTFLINGGRYTDITQSGYAGYLTHDNGGGSFVVGAPFTVSGMVEVGYMMPFSEINFKLNTGRKGGIVLIQYYRAGGTWAPLSVADGTNGLAQSGSIHFTPPADWIMKSENGSNLKYWVRVTTAATAVDPVAARVWGDEWVQTPAAFTLTGSVYTDVTSAVHYGFTNTSVSDTLELGFVQPVPGVDFVLPPANAGAIISAQYWNGAAWTTLTTRDGTSNLGLNGSIEWTTPSNWALKSENGKSAYWVRFVNTGAAVPISTAWCRTALPGYNPTAPGRVNAGTLLEYQPQPPAGASANFLYQSRTAASVYLKNYWWNNPTATSNGINLESDWFTYLSSSLISLVHAQGVFIDDFTTVPQPYLASNSDFTGTDFATSVLAVHAQEKANLQSMFGSNFFEITNATDLTILPYTDKILNEVQNYVWGGVYLSAPAPDISFDSFLTVNNPTNTTGILGMQDVVGVPHGWFSPNDFNSFYPFEAGNRSPMYTLAVYYMGANPNTMLFYSTGGQSTYYFTGDEFWYRAAPTATLTAPVAIDTAGAKSPTPPHLTTFHVTSTAGLSAASKTSSFCADSGRGSWPVVYVGDQTYCLYQVIDGNTFTTFDPVLKAGAVGDPVGPTAQGSQVTDAFPPLSSIILWSQIFPAMLKPIGRPLAARTDSWRKGSRITGLSSCNPACADVAYRPYQNGIVLERMYSHEGTDPQEVITPSQPFCIGNGVYPFCAANQASPAGVWYPLKADGSYGPGVTSLTLRADEGAMLFNAPL